MRGDGWARSREIENVIGDYAMIYAEDFIGDIV